MTNNNDLDINLKIIYNLIEVLTEVSKIIFKIGFSNRFDIGVGITTGTVSCWCTCSWYSLQTSKCIIDRTWLTCQCLE